MIRLCIMNLPGANFNDDLIVPNISIAGVVPQSLRLKRGAQQPLENLYLIYVQVFTTFGKFHMITKFSR